MAKRCRTTRSKLTGWLVAAVAVLAGVLLFVALWSRDPFEGARLYVDPYSNAQRQAEEWRASRPEDAARMDEISAQPAAYWFSRGSEEDVREAVSDRVSTIASEEALPVLVAYNAPLRDCEGNSGAASPEDYRAWIRAFADGIGGREAVVILEPDALALMDCLSETDREARFALLNDAVETLGAEGNVAVYVDAGHSNWVDSTEMAGRLTKAGIKQANGFSLNVSGFEHTDDSIAYGRDLSSRVGDKHFIVDTSRNGLGPPPDGDWCNPPGRALGEKPGAVTPDSLVDAYLWIKPPGESDGECNGGLPAGRWWPEYALGLAERTAY